jgi:hypothetical protein
MNVLTYWKPLAIALAIFMAGLMGYRFGTNAVTAEYEKRDTEAARQYAQALTEAEAEYRKKQQASERLMAATDQHYQDSLKEKDNALKTALAASRTPSGGLYLHTNCPATSQDGMPKVAGASSGDNVATRFRLSNEDAEFLLSLASEADGLSGQLRACQEIVKDDRK